MGLSDSSLLSKVGLVVTVVGVLFTIIGFPTNYWDTLTFAGSSAYNGLFKACQETPLTTMCGDIPSAALTDWLLAVRAMVIIGFLLGLACAVILVVYVFVKTDMKILHLAALGLAFAAAFFVLVGIIIYGAKRNASAFGLTAELGWSFALTVVGGVMHLIAGVILVVDKVMVNGLRLKKDKLIRLMSVCSLEPVSKCSSRYDRILRSLLTNYFQSS